MANVRVLVVDDEDFNRQYLRICLEAAGFELDEAANGVEAWDQLQRKPNAYDAILLDRRMPEMDGMQVLEKIKADPVLKHIPVVMQTALDREQDIIEAMEAGVHYYLTKPYDGQVLVSVVRSATDEFSRHQRLQVEVAKRAGAIGLMSEGRFILHTPKEADALAILLGSGFEKSAAVAMGLSELLINAIEHGNLELDYANKSDLIAEGQWDNVIGGRLGSEAYRDRKITVDVTRNISKTVFTITDEGKGFNWRNYVDLTMDRVFDTHGRGIAMAKKLAFDELEYVGAGNVVKATISHIAKEAEDRSPGDEHGDSSVVCMADVNGSLASTATALKSVAEITVIEGRSDGGVDGVEGEPALWIVSAEAAAPRQGNADNVIFATDDWDTAPVDMSSDANGPISVPRNEHLIEGIVRCLLAPQTMEIGAPSDQRLGPVLGKHQRALLPDPDMVSTALWRVSAHHEACSGVSGDIWGARVLDDARIALYVADFAGHGPVAGVQSFRLHAMLKSLPLSEMGPGQVMAALNARLHRVLPTSQYAAMLYGIVDLGTQRFTYAGAGMPHPVVFGPKNGNFRVGDGKGLPLGVIPDFDYAERALRISKGDTLVLLTDGVFNVVEGGHPGVDAFDHSVAMLNRRNPEETPAGSLAALMTAASRPLGDDACTVCLSVQD